jgi:hypothetical protein
MTSRSYIRNLNRRAIETLDELDPSTTVVKAAYVITRGNGDTFVILDSDLDAPLTPLSQREAFVPKVQDIR